MKASRRGLITSPLSNPEVNKATGTCDTIQCPVQECTEVFKSDCVIYTGPDLSCQDTTVVNTDDTVTEAIQSVVGYFCANGGGGGAGTQGAQGVQGTQGVQGKLGTQGTQGVQGKLGSQGIQGTQGVQGTRGWQGTQGIQGVQGLQGLQGAQGFGIQGIQGPQGPLGVNGLQGTQGTQGIPGEFAAQGVQGTQGIQGVQGVQGTKGNQGTTGQQGGYGPTGLQGAQGTQGIQGGGFNQLQGTQGTAGFAGSNGAQGSTGAEGSQGAQGSQGIQGSQGLQGATGAGIQGSIGTNGIQGAQGKQGIQGLDGLFAAQGIQGIQGPEGIQGPAGSGGGGGAGGRCSTDATLVASNSGYFLSQGDGLLFIGNHETCGWSACEWVSTGICTQDIPHERMTCTVPLSIDLAVYDEIKICGTAVFANFNSETDSGNFQFGLGSVFCDGTFDNLPSTCLIDPTSNFVRFEDTAYGTVCFEATYVVRGTPLQKCRDNIIVYLGVADGFGTYPAQIKFTYSLTAVKTCVDTYYDAQPCCGGLPQLVYGTYFLGATYLGTDGLCYEITGYGTAGTPTLALISSANYVNCVDCLGAHPCP